MPHGQARGSRLCFREWPVPLGSTTMKTGTSADRVGHVYFLLRSTPTCSAMAGRGQTGVACDGGNGAADGFRRKRRNVTIEGREASRSILHQEFGGGGGCVLPDCGNTPAGGGRPGIFFFFPGPNAGAESEDEGRKIRWTGPGRLRDHGGWRRVNSENVDAKGEKTVRR